mgnify:FL=1
MLYMENHRTPMEHQATPMEELHANRFDPLEEWEKGVTHMDRWARLYSGNFSGFIQYRQLL